MIFDSRDIYFKNPFGAVRAGDEVTLRLMLPLSHYSPMLAAEKGGESFRVSFDFVRVQDGINTWQCVFTPKETGVYYYHFEVEPTPASPAFTRRKILPRVLSQVRESFGS